LLAFYVLISLVLMNYNDAFKLIGIRYFLLKSVNVMYGLESFFSRYRNLSEQNEELKQELFKVKLTNQQLREAIFENLRLKKLLKFQRESELTLIPAKVIGNGPEAFGNSLIINIGEKNGITKNMAVLNPDGLVGKILQTTPEYSIVQVLKNPNSLVSARLQKSREAGVIAWSGNSWLDLLYISKNVPVEKGEIVITSGLSQIYPPGIKIGVVGEITEEKYSLFKKIKILPAVDFNALEEVFVAERKPQPSEKDSSE